MTISRRSIPHKSDFTIPREGNVETEQFMKVYNERRIKRFIWAEANRYCKKIREIQEEYVQEGWLALSQAPPDFTLEAYEQIIARAIRAAYMREYRHGTLPNRTVLEGVRLGVDAGLIELKN
jgi:hypothetical protein